MTKTLGLVDVLRESLGPFSAVDSMAFVYGPSPGEEFSESDADLMIVGVVRLAELAPALGRQRNGWAAKSTDPLSADEFAGSSSKRQHFSDDRARRPKAVHHRG